MATASSTVMPRIRAIRVPDRASGETVTLGLGWVPGAGIGAMGEEAPSGIVRPCSKTDGIVTAKCLTHRPRGPAHSGATVLDFHQLPRAVTHLGRYVWAGPPSTPGPAHPDGSFPVTSYRAVPSTSVASTLIPAMPSGRTAVGSSARMTRSASRPGAIVPLACSAWLA